MKQNASPSATKEDIEILRVNVKTDIKTLRADTNFLRGEILSLEGKIENLDEKFTKKLDQVLTRLDPVIAEIENAREDRVLGTYQTSELRKNVDEHEKRIATLEQRQSA